MAKLIGTKEASERLGVSLRRVQQLVENGTLKSEKVGRDYVIDESSLSKVTIYGKRGRPAKAKKAGSE